MVVRGESEAVCAVLLEEEPLEGNIKGAGQQIRQLCKESVFRNTPQRTSESLSIDRDDEQHHQNQQDQAESAVGLLRNSVRSGVQQQDLDNSHFQADRVLLLHRTPSLFVVRQPQKGNNQPVDKAVDRQQVV